MELFKLFGTIALNGVDETHSALDGITNKASGIGSKIASGVGSVAKTVGTAAVGAVAAATTAVTAIGKTAVQSYAEYEQLVGGVDTLFKESSKKVQNYADNAYKTAGLSANEYMNTVTSFSASLLQGLSGDTEAAAEIANTAIVDMSDNANKMGTDMASIQNAYQGFAKKNYTMLDNLKLGYGGTAAEMARLVNESGVLGEAITVTAETINDVSFDKIIEAIHVVQEEMGIAGTTAAEAASTISGSLSSVRSSWANLLTGMSQDDADISQLIGNLTSSLETAAENLLPRITETIGGIGEATVQLAPFFVQAVSTLITDVAPDLIQAGAELADTLITSFANSLIDTSPVLAPIGEMILEVKESLSSAFSTLGENIDWDSVFSGLQDALEVSCGLVSDLAEGFEDFVTYATTEGTPLNDAFSSIKDAASDVVQWFKDNWGDITETMSDTGEKIKGAGEDICTAFSDIVTEITKDGSVKTELTWIKENIFEPLAETMGELAGFAGDVATGIGNIVSNLVQVSRDEGSALHVAVEWFKTDMATAFSKLKDEVGAVCSLLTGDFQGAWDGLKSSVETTIDSWKTKLDTVKTALSEVIEAIKGVDLSNIQGAVGKVANEVIEVVTGKEVDVTKWKDKHPNLQFSGVDGSHAAGLDYVPFDGYIAQLHQGEMVLPENAANALRNGDSGAELVGVMYQVLDAVNRLGDSMNGMTISIGKREFGRVVRTVT